MANNDSSSTRSDRLPDPKRSRHSEVSSSSRRHRSPSPDDHASRRDRERGKDRDRDYTREEKYWEPSRRGDYDKERRFDDRRDRDRDRDRRDERSSRYTPDDYQSSSRKRDRERDDRDYDRERPRERGDRDGRYRDTDDGSRDKHGQRRHEQEDRRREGNEGLGDERKRNGSEDPTRNKISASSGPVANGGISPSILPPSVSTPLSVAGGASPLSIASPLHPTSTATAESEKQRVKREKMEAWKKAQAAKKAAEEVKRLVEEKAKSLGAKVGVTGSTNGNAVLGAATSTVKAADPLSIGGLPAKPSFALPAATLARIGLPLKPTFAALPATSLILGGAPTPTSSTTQIASALLDDTDHSTRKLQKLALPPVDPLVAPGAEAGTNDAVGDDLDFMDDDDEEEPETMTKDEDSMDIDGETNGTAGQPVARKRLIAAARNRFDIGPDKMVVDAPTVIGGASQVPAAADDDEEEDPLDAFMKENTKTVKKVNEDDLQRFGVSAATTGRLQPLGGASAEEGPEDNADDAAEKGNPGEMTSEQILAMAAKKSRKKDLPAPDHDNIKYEPFRKAFYVPGPDSDDLDEETVELMRLEMDGIKIRGKDCPKPVTHWGAFGLPSGCYDVIKRLGYDRPTPIQAQAVPAIMSGRDIIGVAKTGSGKTIAFLLPLFRHIKDQRPIESGEGPMAIIMTPTRELATQIWREAKPFMTAMGMRAVCAYGGSPLSEQIADMKKGCEVVVCTPGRMIDLLTANSGRVTNVRRVTYMVLDEADRMFDMGFEPQVMKIVNNVRPDRQTVLFSATFPQKMDALARKVLIKPLEITVGGRSVVAKEIDQRVEIIAQSSKWLRLLEILGEMGEEHKDDEDFRSLVFVERQESADELFQNLMQKGYICTSLHGGKEQVDRDQAISDFKMGYIPIVIATSVAARGLDVKELKLVINYDCPNHMEDYIHRAGRTGRAGNKGTCMTFITPEQDKYSVDIVRALKASEAYIPPDLQKLSEDFLAKVKAGKAKTAGSGFGGKGLDHIEQEREDKDRAQRSAYGEDGAREENPSQALVKIGETKVKRTGDAGTGSNEPGSHGGHGHGGGGEGADYTFSDFKVEIMAGPAPERIAAANAKLAARNGGVAGGVLGDASSLPPQTLAALQKADAAGKGSDVMGNLQAAVAKIQAALNKNKSDPRSLAPMSASAGEKGADEEPTEWHAIVPINDYPQKARWSATAKEHMSQLQDMSGASITNKGLFYPPGVEPKDGQEPKLYLLIESSDRNKVALAVDELRRRIVEASIKILNSEDRHGQPAGRYRV